MKFNKLGNSLSVSPNVNYRNFGFIPKGSLRRDWRGKLYGHANLFKRLQARDIISAMSVNPTDVVLDFGCGAGFMTIELAKISQKTYGVDIDPKVANIKIPEHLSNRLQFDHVEDAALPFEPEMFDKILASEVLMMVPDPNRFLQQMHHILASDGRLVICNGVGHPAIEEAYTSNSPILRALRWLFPRKVPTSYAEYCRILNQSFQNKYDTFFSIDDIKSLLKDNGFVVEETTYSPGRIAGAYFSWTQFILYLRTGRLLSQRIFLLNFGLFSLIRRFEAECYRGGIICIAKKQT